MIEIILIIGLIVCVVWTLVERYKRNITNDYYNVEKLLQLLPKYHIAFTYTNWKGETAERKVKAKKIYYGSTQYHPEEQWLMEAYDLDKDVVRVFAMKDMKDVRCF